MEHGVAGYFAEQARFQRRLSMCTLAASVAALFVLGLTRAPVVRDLMKRTARFGYEGPDQYVRRIALRQYQGTSRTLSDLGNVAPRLERRGGARATRSSGEGNPQPKARASGPGSSDRDLIARSVSRSANVPIVRSEELVIDRLVKPQYPPPLLERNIEGKVMVQALIDTIGNVIDVQIMASTGESLFERAAEDAVWQCRFRPFRPDGEVSEVYAVFRFVFSIY
jgi:TonB family protein